MLDDPTVPPVAQALYVGLYFAVCMAGLFVVKYAERKRQR